MSGHRRRGHATRPHTADVRIEAWAPTEAGCYEEAVAAFVEVFAAAPLPPGRHRVRCEVGPASPAELLVLLLEEVLAQVEAAASVPVGAHVDVEEDRLEVLLDVVDVGGVRPAGPVPKGVSYEDLEFGAAAGRWWCRATIDV